MQQWRRLAAIETTKTPGQFIFSYEHSAHSFIIQRSKRDNDNDEAIRRLREINWDPVIVVLALTGEDGSNANDGNNFVEQTTKSETIAIDSEGFAYFGISSEVEMVINELAEVEKQQASQSANNGRNPLIPIEHESNL